jgi:hypothetical protein
MREFPLNIRNAEQLKATLGVSLTVYDKLVTDFERYIELEQKLRFHIWMYGEGKKKPSPTPSGKLPTAPLQVAFVLYYLKNYILMETFAERFNMDKGTASKNLKFLLERLHEILSEWQVLPHRSFANPEEMQEYMQAQNWDKILIDVTERRHHRPKDDTEQRALYSGKKKAHGIKNTVMSDENRYIHVLGLTTQGSMHDYQLLKLEWDTIQPWFANATVFADTAYIAMLKDYLFGDILVPFKKKRKPKGQPKDELTPVQKEFNKALAKIRITVEHAIGGMKILHCLKNVWRGRRHNFDDQVILLSAGLWNAHLRFSV